MTLSDVSIRNPVFAWMLMLGLILFGIICFSRMGLAQMPDVAFPVVNVSISLPNAAPEVVESDVADPVEQAVLGVEGVQDVQTTCSQGQASISVYLDLSRDPDIAVQEVQTMIFSVEKHLPDLPAAQEPCVLPRLITPLYPRPYSGQIHKFGRGRPGFLGRLYEP